MTHELMKSFTTWWSASSIACDRGTDCRSAYEAGWEAAITGRTAEREAAELAGRAIEKQVWRAEIMGRAIEAFRDGRNETAQLLRNLANELFEKL